MTTREPSARVAKRQAADSVAPITQAVPDKKARTSAIKVDSVPAVPAASAAPPSRAAPKQLASGKGKGPALSFVEALLASMVRLWSTLLLPVCNLVKCFTFQPVVFPFLRTSQASPQDLQRKAGAGASSSGALLREFVYRRLTELSPDEVAALDDKSSVVHTCQTKGLLTRSEKFYNAAREVAHTSLRC